MLGGGWISESSYAEAWTFSGVTIAFALIIDSGKVFWGKLYRVGFFVPYAVPTVIESGRLEKTSFLR